MILLAAESVELEPIYSTQFASCADIRASAETYIAPGEIKLISTGLRIRGVLESQLVPGIIPEIQVRSRSGLASKGVVVVGGVGTIDVDYSGEILVPLINLGSEGYQVSRLDKIAQITLGLRGKLPGVKTLEVIRGAGGFGSTGA